MKEVTQNTLGVVLEYVRNKYAFSLKKVCNGLCAETTLWNIELGERKNVDSLLGELLLDRLGKEVTQFELVLDEKDYQRWSKRDKIAKAMQTGMYDIVRAELEEYEKISPEKDKLHRQFYLFYKVKLEIATTQNIEKIQQLAKEALLITKPEFEKKRGNDELYTQVEIELILSLIHFGYKGLEDYEEWELMQLLHYAEKYYTGRKREDVGLQIIMEFIDLSQRMQDDCKLLKYIEKGIAMIAQGREIKNLAQLHFMKAQTLLRLHEGKKDCHEYRKEIKEECLMAYSIYELMGKETQRIEIEQFCEERLQWQITELVM